MTWLARFQKRTGENPERFAACRSLGLLCGVCCCALLFIVGPALLRADARAAYRIGAVLPLSGPMAFAGAEVRDAINLALSKLGPSQTKFTVLFEDNGAGPTATASATHKLLEQDQVNAIITLWPEAANVAAPITEAKKILHWTIAWDPAIACSRKYVLSHQAMLTDYARKTLELLRARGVKKLAFFHDTVFQQGADVVAQLAPEYGVRFTKAIIFDRGKNDFRTELVTARSAKADAFLIWSIMPETEIFLRQIHELRIKSYVTGFFDVLQDLSLIDGLEFPSEVYATPKFEEAFLERYGHAATMKGPNAFDIINLLSRAVNQVQGEPTAAAVKEKLLGVSNYAGAVGTVSIDKCGNSSYPIVIKRVQAGRLVVSE